jgi:hypothetical protein
VGAREFIIGVVLSVFENARPGGRTAGWMVCLPESLARLCRIAGTITASARSESFND